MAPIIISVKKTLKSNNINYKEKKRNQEQENQYISIILNNHYFIYIKKLMILSPWIYLVLNLIFNTQ